MTMKLQIQTANLLQVKLSYDLFAPVVSVFVNNVMSDAYDDAV